MQMNIGFHQSDKYKVPGDSGVGSAYTSTDEHIDTETDEKVEEYLIFTVNSISFGVDISIVQEIIKMQKIYPIPNSLPHCKGIINLRGTIVPVIDTRIKLGYEPAPYDENTCIVIIKIDTDRVGMIVDRVNEVARLTPDEIANAPGTLGRGVKSGGMIEKLARGGEKVHQILDVYTVLSIPRA